MKVIVLSVFFVLNLFALTIAGIGYGNYEKESKQEALGDLSNKISVDVKSEYKTIVKDLGKEFEKLNEKTTKLSSNLPLKGVDLDVESEDGMVKTVATITSEKVLHLYESELKRLSDNISKTLVLYPSMRDDDAKYETLNRILRDIESFHKHKTVAILLGSKKIIKLKITKSEVESKLQDFLHAAPTIKIASSILTKNMKEQSIYVGSIKPSGSSEVTQLAKIIKNETSQYLSIVTKPSKAEYILKGEYQVLKKGIYIHLQLSDLHNNVVKSSTVTLDPNAYKNIQFKPSTISFDESLNSGSLRSAKLYVNIGFKGFYQEDGIDLNNGETVDIVLKSNKEMCYFLVGHVLKKDEKFSYLLPIGTSNIPFVNRLTGEDVNKNIVIAEDVPVSAPFGSENLQVFSSTFDQNGYCPLVVPSCEENEDGLCVIDGKPGSVIRKTRALNLKKKKFKIEKAEDSISFTTFK